MGGKGGGKMMAEGEREREGGLHVRGDRMISGGMDREQE